MSAAKKNRKQEILEALATQLESSCGRRITTAALAASIGVSEAALYRHFPSKAQMFEGLIEFAESTLFSRINHILLQEKSTSIRCLQIIRLFLTFAERNPGIVTVISGDALASEDDRLRRRVAKLWDRLEAQLKQTLRESSMRKDVVLAASAESAAVLLLAHIQGMLYRFQQTNFQLSPLSSEDELNSLLLRAIFIAS